MLALSPPVSTKRYDQPSPTAAAFVDSTPEDFPVFTVVDDDVKSLDFLEGIDYFDNLFSGDVLPDLEVDPVILGEYSGGSESNSNTSPGTEKKRGNGEGGMVKTVRRGKKDSYKRKKSSSRREKGKDDEGKSNSTSVLIKKKAKVDWTPELHRRFVQAVEQLGVEKAVPSRILELMGVHSLTRHNVASHLQKYRSHRKHLLAREAEAASWNLRRQAVAAVGGGKKPWMAPTLGFPHVHPFRPLHVWGHPTWPKHKAHSPSLPPPPSWPVAPQPPTPAFWHQHPIYPQPVASQLGYGGPPVPGIPSPNQAIYKSGIGIGVSISNTGNLPADINLSKDSIDAALGDVISKPWLPLPLGLKPPSLDGVITELQRQGISKVPPCP